ncbi:MAG: hypothetical protein ABIO39_05370, partial [Caulobacteraceae bacterium]
MCRVVWGAVALIALPLEGVAFAATAPAGFKVPNISEAYTKKLQALPDWNGDWYFEGGLMFDPANQVLGKDDGTGFYTGPAPGSYLKNI